MSINPRITTRKILQKYAYLLPTDQFRTWDGYININDHHIKLKAAVPFYPLIQEMKLELGIDVAKHLRPTTMDSILRCNDFSQVLDLLVFELRTKCSENATTPSSALWSDTHMDLLRCLLQDLKTDVGMENLSSMDEDLKWVRLKYEDSTGESHEMTVEIPPGFKGGGDLKVLEANLPTTSLAGIQGMQNLGEMYNAFTAIVESLIPFWRMCEDFDTQVWVLDPESPSKQHTYRRIYLDNMTSMLVTFDPSSIYEAPEVNFCGTFKTAKLFKETYRKNHDTSGWNSEISVTRNLERLLDIPKLPQRPDRDNAKKTTETLLICSICLDTADNGDVPGRWCPNDKCSSVFHHECLIKWFQSLPTIKSVFEFTGGPCPSCKTKTWCPAKGNAMPHC